MLFLVTLAGALLADAGNGMWVFSYLSGSVTMILMYEWWVVNRD